MEGSYRASMVSGGMRRAEPSVVARAFAGLMIGVILLKSVEGDGGPLEHMPKERLADELLDFVLHGLSNGNPQEKEGATS